jgi:putative oxidoreductase
VGLCLLRLAAGLSLLYPEQIPRVLGDGTNVLTLGSLVGVGVLLWLGLWTPVAAVVAAVAQIGLMSLDHHYDAASALAGIMCLALAMLGPGAWSLDARLFGRKRIV